MDQPQNFRSAFNGFNREDVVHYLEYLNNKHNSEIVRLNQEIDQLNIKLNTVDPDQETHFQELENQLAEAGARKTELEDQVSTLTAENARKDEKIAQLEAQLQEALNTPAPTPQKEAPVIMQSSAMHELEAYRRAERAERMAKERAEQVYRQTNGILSDATVKVEEAAKQIGTVTDQVMAQLNLLQCAVGSSRLALQEAAATMYGLCPEGE